MKQIMTKRLWWLGLCLVASVSIFIFIILSRTPSHERVWEIGQERTPTVTVTDDELTVQNFRDFTWTGELEADGLYRTKTFTISDLTNVDIIISHFHWFEGIAHIMFAFNFTDDEPLIVSVETRREAGEEFSPFWGMLRQFEIIYVLGSARDIVGARLGVREERVYRFPTVLTPDESRAFLLALIEDTNSLAADPAFYHTITDNCTNLVTNRLADTTRFDIPPSWRVTLPGYLPKLLFEIGLIANATPDTDKEVFRITSY